MAEREPLKATKKSKGGAANLVPFPKGKSGNPGGRKPKTVTWRAAEDALRSAFPRVLLMTDKERSKLQTSPDTTGAEQLALVYIQEHPVEAVNRLLGRVPTELTGKDGAPLIPAMPPPIIPALSFDGWIPDQIAAFVDATAALAKRPQEPAAKPE